MRKGVGSRQTFILVGSLLNRRCLAILFWKRLLTGNIGAALIAGRILRVLSGYAKRKEELTLHFDLLKHADEFENLATYVLDMCYESDKELAELVLVRTLHAWGKTTCLSIAYSAQHMKFMEHDCCQTKLLRIWKGNLLINSKAQWLTFFVATILPIFPFMSFIDTESEVRHSGLKSEEVEERHSGFKCEDVTFFEGMRYYYTAPITKFIYSMVSYVLLLLLFAFFIMTDLRPNGEPSSPGTVEWIVVFWVCTLVLEEVRQLVARGPASMKYRLYSWLSEGWNRFDLAMYVLFAVSFVLRLVLPPCGFGVARVMYCITFISFSIRFLHMGFVFEGVGPKIIMIIKMMKDLGLFLFILIIFVASFGIAREALSNPNMKPHILLMFQSLYKPYWQLYGELFLEEDEVAVENATLHGDVRSVNICTLIDGHGWISTTLTAIYMLISNILLINLLIAMFSFTFQRVQDKSELIWRFYRFGLISEYHNRPTLVPPLIVINHVYRLIIELKQRFSPDKEEESNSLRVHLKKGSRIDEDVNLFESKHLQSYFIKENIKEKKSSQSMVTSAAERLTKVEERLDNLEKHVAEILKMVSAKEFKESKMEKNIAEILKILKK
ncbi:transient receptor potential cation channel subfamily M member 1-like [Ptychodera flava]|uniref:transient receptor potential cation channel subfamily M member 1-like n=1 Tax=Ptychodera flava TaxID=63121 RepID=UPI00396A88C4